jgi:phosphohistidine phosphatase
MLRLLLLRHAKSDWSDPALSDHDRPLGPRGLKAVPLIAAVMARKGLVPAACLTSTASRARDTARLVLAGLAQGADIAVTPLPALYDFGSGREAAAAIAVHGGTATPLLVVGHNPAFHRLALRLAADGGKADMAKLKRKFPAGALAVIDLAIAAWADLPGATGRLCAFIRPRAINGDD